MKCQAASSASKVVANPTLTYAIFSNNSPEYSSDKYNVIYGLGKRLPGYFYFALTDDNRQPWKV